MDANILLWICLAIILVLVIVMACFVVFLKFILNMFLGAAEDFWNRRN